MDWQGIIMGVGVVSAGLAFICGGIYFGFKDMGKVIK